MISKLTGTNKQYMSDKTITLHSTFTVIFSHSDVFLMQLKQHQ